MSVNGYEAALAVWRHAHGIDGPDAGAELRDRPPKPCSTRLASGDWCLLAPDHEGECAAVLPPRLAIGTQSIVQGLVRCARCRQDARPMNGHLSVHFAMPKDQRPCPNSWPARPEAKSK